MKQDGRRDQRQPISLKVRFKSATLSDFIEKHSGDVSQGGIFIKTKKPMPVGTLLKFEFKLKDDQDLINGVGRVVWSRVKPVSDTEPAGMGIKFIKLDEASQGRIHEIVEGSGKKSGMNIDEPFGEETNASFPRSLLEEQLAAQNEGPSDAGDPIAPAKVAPPPSREKPPIAVPVPTPRASADRFSDDQKRTMLGMAAVSAPEPKEKPAVPVPGPKGDRGSSTILGIPGVVPLLSSDEGATDSSPDSTGFDSSTPEAPSEVQVEFKPGPDGARESGILKDISQAIDSALTRRAVTPLATPVEEPEAEPPHEDGADAQEDARESVDGDVPQGSGETPDETEDSRVSDEDASDEDVGSEGEPSPIVPAFPDGEEAQSADVDEPVPGADEATSEKDDDEKDDDEEDDHEDIRAHEAVVIADTATRPSMVPNKPVVEATRAGAEEKSPGSRAPLGGIIVVVLLIGIGGAAAWWFLIEGGSVEELKQLVGVAAIDAPVVDAGVTKGEPEKAVAIPQPPLATGQNTDHARAAGMEGAASAAAAPTEEPAEPVLVNLSVVTQPSGARLYVGGTRQVGVTPLDVPEVEVGKKVELEVVLFGYRSQKSRLVPTAEPQPIQIKLVPTERVVNLEGTPLTASVYINGKPAGKLGSQARIEKIGPGLSYMVRKTGYTTRRGKLGPADWREKDGVWVATVKANLVKTEAPAPTPGAAPEKKPAAKPAKEAPKTIEKEPAPAPKPPAPKKKPKPKKPAPAKPSDGGIDENPF